MESISTRGLKLFFNNYCLNLSNSLTDGQDDLIYNNSLYHFSERYMSEFCEFGMVLR